ERVARVVERLAREHDLVASDSGREAEPGDPAPYGGRRVVRVKVGERLTLDADHAPSYRLGEAGHAATRPTREVPVGGEPVLPARELSDGEVNEGARTRWELHRRGGRFRRHRSHDGHAVERQLSGAGAEARGAAVRGDLDPLRANAGVVELARDPLCAVTRDVDVLRRRAVAFACIAVDDERGHGRLRARPRDE